MFFFCSPVKEEPLSSLYPDMVLYRASEADNLGMISYSLALEANKNWHNPDDNGQTPLHQAVASVSNQISFQVEDSNHTIYVKFKQLVRHHTSQP